MEVNRFARPDCLKCSIKEIVDHMGLARRQPAGSIVEGDHSRVGMPFEHRPHQLSFSQVGQHIRERQHGHTQAKRAAFIMEEGSLITMFSVLRCSHLFAVRSKHRPFPDASRATPRIWPMSSS
ncbi:hypothetical protein BZM27_50260 [Paraburkholderia steynii]|uniref:Uncharacterized protein n=1 Tax=Paraburkholderia steynii TaxID=1245441 RepID=A0A4R0XBB4_9BURK|nr:hypothetical protein BZM27_50260 [Paraburkholderia steynii]